jgi:hypothetical protein
VLADGTVSQTNGFPVRVSPGQQTAPSAAFNGYDYLVAWQEARSSASNSFDIFGAGISPEAKVFGATPLLINVNPLNQLGPKVASGSDARFLVSSEGWQFLSRRAVANLVNLEAIPRLDGGALTPNSSFEFRFQGGVGLNYAIESSDDLGLWKTFATFIPTNQSIQLTDPAGNTPQRFYRAILNP